MNWYPNTGWLPALGQLWPSGVVSTSLTLTVLMGCAQLALLALRAVRDRVQTVSVPCESVDFDDEEVTKTAA
jgi:hypothetical protein